MIQPDAPALSIDDAIKILRSADVEDLKDCVWLERHLLPTLGLHEDSVGEYPRSLIPWCGHGVHSWQYPSQFSKYLASLHDKNIQSYIEIGCRHGGTFIITREYLLRFQNLTRSLAVDIERSPIISDYVARYSIQDQPIEYLLESSTSSGFKKQMAYARFDLCLIDGDHSAEACMSDFVTMKDSARVIAFHDTDSTVCPGVTEVWSKIKQFNPLRVISEFHDQYPEVKSRTGKHFLGLGCLDYS